MTDDCPLVSELADEPVLGRWYRVPCVLRKLSYSESHAELTWFPVIGPAHSDEGQAKEHYHYDYRFMPDMMLSAVGRRDLGAFTPFFTATVATPSYPLPAGAEGARLKRHRCFRRMPICPASLAIGLRLDAKYFNCALDPSQPVCLHRGIPLNGLPQANGVVVCPGHGLRWNLKTGRMANLVMD